MDTVSASTTVIITIPVGTVTSYVGSNPPEGWLLCNGQTIDQATYPNLFPLLSGGKVPDLRSRFIVGAGQGDNLSSYPINQTGGLESVTLTVDQIPSHSHQINNGNFGLHYQSFQGESDNDIPFESNPNTNLGGTNNTGGGKSHENRPPFYALTYIVKY